MYQLSVKTKGNADPKGRPRIYFTCHPADLERSLDRICQDIFQAQDCAVYYTPDMSEPIPEDAMETDLGRMNLFVIPVSYRLLYEPNRAMDADFPFAVRENIPVLPILLENGLDKPYSQPDKFGSLQYLNPLSTDVTEIRYEDKLKKFLDQMLISGETAQRIRDAFDAYIFLSYRKKDRKYANELMRLIHRNPECRDIAIWFDEFLTPGESFVGAIEQALEKSKLFTLVVTPNLVTEANYVQQVEYPAAAATGKEIFPVEMLETDQKSLQHQYPGIPRCTNPYDTDAFRARVLSAVRSVAHTANDDDPAHNFLIGLAYLDGIDVEVDRPRAVELIRGAAEANLPEAMRKLRTMYQSGLGVARQYGEAVRWSKRLADWSEAQYGPDHPDTIAARTDLGEDYLLNGQYDKALETEEKVYAAARKALGEENPLTLSVLSTLASARDKLGYHQRALELRKKLSDLRQKVLGPDHPDAIRASHELAVSYLNLENNEKGMELLQDCLERSRRVNGEEHPDTLAIQGDMAIAWGVLGEKEQEEELTQQTYALSCKVLGEDDPRTLALLSSLVWQAEHAMDLERAQELAEQLISRRTAVLGPDHPDTQAGRDLIQEIQEAAEAQADDAEKLRQAEAAYQRKLEELGPASLSTIYAAGAVADCCQFWDWKRAILWRERETAGLEKVLGENHDKTWGSMRSLYYAYSLGKEKEKALEISRTLYERKRQCCGPYHADTLETLADMARAYAGLGQPERMLEILEKAAADCSAALGEDHPNTIEMLQALADAYKITGDTDGQIRALERKEQAQIQAKGPFDHSLSTTQDALENLYEQQGETHKLYGLRQRIYAQNQHEYGEENVLTLYSAEFLAFSARDVGDYPLALDMAAKTYEICCRIYGDVLGPEKNAAQNAKRLQAEVQRKMGKHRKAEGIERQIYETKGNAQGETHSDTIQELEHMVLSSPMGEEDKAKLEAVRQRIAELEEAVGDEEHLEAIAALESLSDTAGMAENYETAYALARKACDLRRKVQGEDHPDTLRSMDALAFAAAWAGDRDTCSALLEQVWKITADRYGETSPEALEARIQIASGLLAAGDTENAVEMAEQVYEDCKRDLGEAYPVTLKAMTQYAEACAQDGDPEQATELLEQAYGRSREALGETDPQTQDIRNALERRYREDGAEEKRLALLQEEYQAALGRQGEDSESAIRTLQELAQSAAAAGDGDTALTAARKVYETRRRLQGDGALETLEALVDLAEITAQAGDPAEAQDLAERARAQADVLQDQLTDDMYRSMLLGRIGGVYRALGRMDLALETTFPQLLSTLQYASAADVQGAAALYEQFGLHEQAEMLLAALKD